MIDQPHDLALIDRARAALAEARSVPEVKEVRDKAAALAHYHARQAGAEESRRYANEIALRAARRIGELTAEMERAKPGGATDGKKGGSRVPDGNTRKQDALAAVGLTRKDAHVCEAIAAVPEETFEAEVVKPKASTAGLARLGREARPRPKRKTAPVRVTRPTPDDRLMALKVKLFRGDVDRVVRKHLARWPSGVPTTPLATVLLEIAGTLKEEA